MTWFNFSQFYDDVFSRLATKTGPIRIFEIGVWMGDSTAYLANLIRQSGKQIEFHCCDVFTAHDQYQFDDLNEGDCFRHVFENHLLACGLTDFVTIHQGRSQDVLASFPDYYFDFVFIDGSHSYRDVCQDIQNGLKKLKADGILAGHDYGLPDVADSLKSLGLTHKMHGGDVWEVTNKIGIVYVAWGTHILGEAINSSWWSKLPTCLITDLDSQVPNNAFGQVIRVDFHEYDGLHYFYRKMEAIKRTPFDLTLYLDADTFPIGDLSLGFQKADQFGFAAVIAPGYSFSWHDREYIHYNCGVIWFKGRPIEWVEKVLNLSTTFTECDEPAWSIAWDEMGINVATLPETYNFVVAGPLVDRPVRIWHSRQPPHKNLTHQFGEFYRA